MPRFIDDAELSGVHVTSEGYLIADAFTVRTGIQRYTGTEVGRPDLVFVDVYRPEEEVFSHESLQSFAHKPVTVNHPTEAVTKDNWDKLAVGEASTDVLRDGQRMKIPLIVKGAKGIAAVQDGIRELSAGYTCDLEFKDGVTEDGEPYQAIQRNIRANHIAIVRRGRAGADFRFGDADTWGAAPITLDTEPTMNTRTIIVDGLSVVTTDQGAQAIEKLQTTVSKMATDAVAVANAHQSELNTRDTKIGELTAQLADAQGKIPTGDKLDKMVADRAALVTNAKAVKADIVTDGKSDAEIRRAVVASKLGDEFVKDAADAVIEGAFHALTRDTASKTADPVRTQMMGRDSSMVRLADNGQSAYEDRLGNQWKTAATA